MLLPCTLLALFPSSNGSIVYAFRPAFAFTFLLTACQARCFTAKISTKEENSSNSNSSTHHKQAGTCSSSGEEEWQDDDFELSALVKQRNSKNRVQRINVRSNSSSNNNCHRKQGGSSSSSDKQEWLDNSFELPLVKRRDAKSKAHKAGRQQKSAGRLDSIKAESRPRRRGDNKARPAAAAAAAASTRVTGARDMPRLALAAVKDEILSCDSDPWSVERFEGSDSEEEEVEAGRCSKETVLFSLDSSLEGILVGDKRRRGKRRSRAAEDDAHRDTRSRHFSPMMPVSGGLSCNGEGLVCFCQRFFRCFVVVSGRWEDKK